MSDQTPDKNAATGATASDAAPSTAVPRINKSVTGTSTPSKTEAASSGGSAAKNGSPSGPAKQRITAGTGSTSERHPKPVVKAEPGKSGAKQPIDGVTAVTRSPITAGEYARTTKSSASSTAVIPAVKDDAPSAAQAATASAGRQASLKLVRVDPWSVTKVVFALTVALMIVAVVAVTILWIVLSFAGVWDQINSSVTTVLSDSSNSFDITQYIGFGRVVGLTLVISAINVVITTAVATIGAYLYNLASQLLGGVDVTLAEED